MIIQFNKKDKPIKGVKDSGSLPSSMFNAYPDLTPGVGYSSDMQMATFPCVNNEQISYQGNSSFTLFGASVSFEQMINQLIVSTDPKDNLWIFSSNPAASYAQTVSDTLYSQSYYFVETVLFPSKTLTPIGTGVEALNFFGQGAYKAGSDQFRATCGNKFVLAEQQGAALFLTMQLNFNRLADKANFIKQAGASFPNITTAYSDIETVVTNNKLAGNLELLLFQSGGDATQLSQILTKNGTSGNYYLTTCDFSTITDCQGAMNAIMSYGQNTFPLQVSFKGEIVGNAVPQAITFMNYTDLGLTIGSSVLTPAATLARDQLTQLYLDMKAEVGLVNKVLNSEFGIYTEPITAEIFSNFSSAVTYNSDLITNPINGISGCYVRPANCLNITSNINNQLMPVDMGAIDAVLDGFQVGYAFSGIVVNVDEHICNLTYLPIGQTLFLPSDKYVCSNTDDTTGFNFIFSQQIIENYENIIIFNTTTPFSGTWFLLPWGTLLSILTLILSVLNISSTELVIGELELYSSTNGPVDGPFIGEISLKPCDSDIF